MSPFEDEDSNEGAMAAKIEVTSSYNKNPLRNAPTVPPNKFDQDQEDPSSLTNRDGIIQKSLTVQPQSNQEEIPVGSSYNLASYLPRQSQIKRSYQTGLDNIYSKYSQFTAKNDPSVAGDQPQIAADLDN